ncbi:hypothetical protein [Haloprofundus halobius]|uniref:hypothetical protein n=1 Tax=Haloprofundus halobius TaxID=2876194 RepID=UPI001CCC4FAE|nr:hypothetical protein [Haloprofundus halobius]
MISKLSVALVGKKSVLALILLSTVVLGAGYGMVNTPLGEDPSQAADPTVTTNSTPDPTVTPPPTETPDEGDGDGSETQSTTETATPDDSERSNDADGDDRSNADRDDQSDRSDHDDHHDRDRRDTDFSLSVGSPDEIRSDDGSVDSVDGALSGSLSYSRADIDTIVFVVNTRTDDGDWQEVRRETVDTDGDRTVDLRSAFGDDPVTYLDGDRTASFANEDDGTTVERTGRVAVTAVLYDGDRRVTSTTDRGGYSVDVTNIEAQAGADAESDATVSALDGNVLAASLAR